MSLPAHPSPLTSAAALPFSQACENNQAPIAQVLKSAFASCTKVLEIGSGTGQHSVFFAPRLPHLIWQTSDLRANHAGIEAWQQAHPAPNLRAPLELDLASSEWPADEGQPFDAVFTSNTCHIVAWPLVQRLFSLLGQHLPAGGMLVIYGPFNDNGRFTSESNRAFDAWLRQRDPRSGLRDVQAMDALALAQGLEKMGEHAMPANNRSLVYRKI